jgi:hypothetical protein
MSDAGTAAERGSAGFPEADGHTRTDGPTEDLGLTRAAPLVPYPGGKTTRPHRDRVGYAAAQQRISPFCASAQSVPRVPRDRMPLADARSGAR